MDVDITNNGLVDSNDPGNIKPILQDTSVSGVSFSQLFFWNRVLFVTSLLLCVSQCLVSGLLLNNGFPEDWPGNQLKMFDLWFPELFGGFLGLAVMFYCRLVLIHAKELAVRSMKCEAQNSQRLYIPWSGANSASKSSLLWMLIVPTIVSVGLFVVSTVSLAMSVSVVKKLQTTDNPDSGHAFSVVLLCLHFLVVFCKIFILVLGIVIPVVILVISNCRHFFFLSKRIYPFAVYLEGIQDAKPLLIEL